jgi:hypothetical protein
MSAGATPKPLVCWNCNWVLGVISRLPNTRTPVLHVYRRSRQLWRPDEEDVPNWMLFSGMVEQGSVYCDHCGGKTRWDINAHGLEELIRRVRRRGLRLITPMVVEVEGV